MARSNKSFSFSEFPGGFRDLASRFPLVCRLEKVFGSAKDLDRRVVTKCISFGALLKLRLYLQAAGFGFATMVRARSITA